MSVGRIVSSCLASLGVAGCALVAVNMSRAASAPTAADSVVPPSAAPRTVSAPRTVAALPALPTVRPTVTAPSSTAPAPVVPAHSAPVHGATVAAPSSVPPAPGPVAAAPTTSAVAAPRTSSAAPRPAPVVHTTAPRPTPRPAPHTTAARLPTGQALPLGYSTGTATRVITVTARSTYSTTATLQAWTRAAGGGWLRYGSAVTAHIGSQGLSTHPSESRSATPIGSFTLTRAFGHYANPGTPLPYRHTTPADWWISQAGPLYNTLQHCSSGCGFTRGDPNEHLYYETPYYNYAVVIDYNTRNAPGGVRQGAGSAFFLHVTDGTATAGCVAIPQAKLISLMRWLSPTAHPRILIGVR